MKYFVFLTLIVTFPSCGKKAYFPSDSLRIYIDVQSARSPSYKIGIIRVKHNVNESPDSLIKLPESDFNSLCMELNELNFSEKRYTGWSNYPSTIIVSSTETIYYFQGEQDKFEEILFKYIDVKERKATDK